jgi:chemotaxis protein MotD
LPSVAVVPAVSTAAAPSATAAATAATATRPAKAGAAAGTADFNTEIKAALGDDAAPASGADKPAAPATGAAPAAADAAIDADTLAALIAAAGNETGDAAVSPEKAALDALLAKLGLTRDANGNVVPAEDDAKPAATSDGDAAKADDATDKAATDLAAALAALAALVTPAAPQPTAATAGETETAAKAVTAPATAPATPKAPDLAIPMPQPQQQPGRIAADAAAPAVELPAVPVLPATVAAAASEPTSDASQDAATAAAATVAETAPQPAARGSTAATRAEERLRRIAAEVARLAGGDEAATNGISITGRAAPVQPAAEAASTPAATLGELLAIAERGANEAPAPVKTRAGEILTPVIPPSGPIADAAPVLATMTPAVQTPASVPAQQATLDALAQTVAAHAARQESRFEIKLNPAELGKVDVSLNIAADGTVQAHLRVERAETLDMMLRDQSHLQRALEQSGLNVGSGGLQFSLQQQGQGWERPAAPETSVAAAEDDDAAQPVEAVAAARLYSRAGPGGIDLRV